MVAHLLRSDLYLRVALPDRAHSSLRGKGRIDCIVKGLADLLENLTLRHNLLLTVIGDVRHIVPRVGVPSPPFMTVCCSMKPRCRLCSLRSRVRKASCPGTCKLLLILEQSPADGS